MHYKPEYKVYVITGEESGENIAYEILKKITNKINIKFYGIGGDKLKRLGLEPIFSASETFNYGNTRNYSKNSKIN